MQLYEALTKRFLEEEDVIVIAQSPAQPCLQAKGSRMRGCIRTSPRKEGKNCGGKSAQQQVRPWALAGNCDRDHAMTDTAIALIVELLFPKQTAPSLCSRPHRVDPRSPYAGHLSPHFPVHAERLPPSHWDYMLSDQYFQILYQGFIPREQLPAATFCELNQARGDQSLSKQGESRVGARGRKLTSSIPALSSRKEQMRTNILILLCCSFW